MLSRYCPECGYDRDSKKANEKAAMLAIFKRKEKIKKIATISIMLVLCITVAIIVAVNLASPFRMGKVSKVTIGMSQAKVEQILGEPTVIDEDDYYWYSGKVAKMVEKAESKLEESFMSGDGEDMDAAIEEYDKAYAEIADMTYKFIKVDFDSDDKVSEIFFDKKHKYSEDDDYSTDKKTVKEASLALGSVDAYDIDDRVVMAQEMDEIVYCVKFSDGSYYSSTVYASDLSNDDIKRTEKGHSTVYKWSDHHGLGEYSAEKSVNILCSVKDGVLKNWYGEQEEITLPSAAKRIGDYSIGNNAVKTINIHSGVSNIDKNAFSGCVQLATINYDGTIEQWQATYGKNGSHLNGSDVGSYRVICTNGKTCMACDARGHEMRVATCFLPSTCKNCDYTYGDALGHAWESATCVNPRTCSRCQKTEGDINENNHDWQAATCVKPRTCSGCQKTDGDALGHDWKEATCIEAKTCSRCQVTEGESLGHDWIDATCTAAKTCSRCQETEGEELGHDYADGICLVCDALQSAGLEFVLENGTYTVRVGTCKDTDIVIPSTYNGKVVTSIGGSAFYGCSSLTSITIPDSVTSIGYNAFSGCSNLTSITIPDGVTSISNYAFSGCSRLKYNIYDNAKYLGNENNPYLVLIKALDTDITSCNIHEDAKIIANSAFENCSSLTSVTIPDSVTSIGNSAFSGCSSLTSVTIGNSVTSIGEWAFRGCSSLTSITIPDSVTSIGDRAFYECSSLEYNIYDNAKYLGNENNPDVVLIEATGTDIKSCQIHENTKVIYQSAFYECSSLTSITIPDNVTSIGDYAFRYCSSLTSVTIPDSVTSIGFEAFYDCSSLNAVYITDIAAWCGIEFDSYYSNPLECAHNLYLNGELVTELVIPDSVTSIGSSAFDGCSSLTSINIPDSVTSIGWSAFYGCSSLKYNIYDNAKYLGNENNPYLALIEASDTDITSCNIHEDAKIIACSAFSGCSSLTSITIPDSVTSIGYSAFSGCSSLTSITIPFVGTTKNGTGSTHFGCIFGAPGYDNNYNYVPNSLKTVIITGGTSIGDHAFYECSNLTSVTIPDGVTSIGEDAFRGCSSLTSISIPDSVTSIGEFAFYCCSSLKSITIPDSVTSIGSWAFSGCSSLTDINYSGTKAEWEAISKGWSWDGWTGEYTVHCSDGDISKADS